MEKSIKEKDLRRQLILDIKVSSKFTFDNFFCSAQNELAYKALQSVCQEPFTAYNPLYIYGETGAGKTHLLKAVVNYFYKHKPQWKVIYISAAEFIPRYNNNPIYSAKLIDLIKGYREVEILLLDDIHLLGQEENIQEHIFHVYNSLMQAGKQIILAGKFPPLELPKFSRHLVSRFLSGPVIQISVIDDDTRKEILKKIAADYGMIISETVLKYILNHGPRDIGVFEKIIKTISEFSLSQKKEVSVLLVKEVLGKFNTHD